MKIPMIKKKYVKREFPKKLNDEMEQSTLKDYDDDS